MPIDTAVPAATGRPNALPGWQPQELGLGRAAVISGAFVAALAAGLVWLAAGLVVPEPPQPVAVRVVEPAETAAVPASTLAETAAVPASTVAEPTAPPLATPPPVSPTAVDPAPDLTPPSLPQQSLLDVASDLAVVATPDLVPLLTPELARLAPTVSPPIVRKRRAPVAHPAPPRAVNVAPRDALEPIMAQATLPASVAPAAPTAPRPTMAAPDTISGLGAYQSALHRQIERNLQADRAVAGLGVGGTTVIVASIAPDGRLTEAHIIRSSGNRAIDQVALGAVQRGGFAAFGLHMPGEPITISVPISVEAD